MADVVTAVASVVLAVEASVYLTVLLIRQVMASGYRRREEAADAQMKHRAEEEARKSDAMDEGFDNLMRYSVRGNDGFGGGT